MNAHQYRTTPSQHSPRNVLSISPDKNTSQTTSTWTTSVFSQKAVTPLIAGVSGGIVSTVLLLPLDNIKVRLQVNEGNETKSRSTTSSMPRPTNRLGAIQMMRGVLRHEGIRGLYQGLTPAVVGAAGSWGGFFYVYEAMKKHMIHKKTLQQGMQVQQIELNSLENFQVATLSGMVMVFLTNPIWLIKLRMQLQMKRSSQELKSAARTVTHYDGILDAVQKIVRQEGFWALYKGTGPALLLTSHGGVQFMVYEFLRKHFHYARDQRKSESKTSDLAVSASSSSSVLERFENSLGYLTIGAISKMIASTVTYPLQVVKSRMQQPTSSVELTNTGDVRVVSRTYYTGMIATVSKIWQQEGISGFFKGAIPNAIRVAPSAAVTFVVYEYVMDMLQA